MNRTCGGGSYLSHDPCVGDQIHPELRDQYAYNKGYFIAISQVTTLFMNMNKERELSHEI